MSRIDLPSTEQSQGQTGMTEQMCEQVSSATRQLRESARECYQQGREKAMEWEQELEQYVRERPVKSMLIAAGIGVAVGILWRRS